MTSLIATTRLPILVAAGDQARIRFLEFFTANIQSQHRRA
jgi:hypothetical protein